MPTMLGLELHEAAASGDYDALEELLHSGKFDVNLGDEDWDSKTALHWSCQKGFVECCRLLLDNGAKGTSRTNAGLTPAHFAAEAGRVSILRALHAANIPTDKPDNYGSRPSRVAEIYDQQECLRFLKQAEQELAERRERFELVDLSEGEDDEQVSKDTLEEAQEKGKHSTRAERDKKTNKDEKEKKPSKDGKERKHGKEDKDKKPAKDEKDRKTAKNEQEGKAAKDDKNKKTPREKASNKKKQTPRSLSRKLS